LGAGGRGVGLSHVDEGRRERRRAAACRARATSLGWNREINNSIWKVGAPSRVPRIEGRTEDLGVHSNLRAIGGHVAVVCLDWTPIFSYGGSSRGPLELL
jgi:hypothetical protein